MAGTKKINSNINVLGNIKVSTVPNNTGTLLTYNSSTKLISTRTNAQILSDLGLTSVVSNSHTHSNKTVLDGITAAKVSNWDTSFGWGDYRQFGLGVNIGSNYGSWSLTSGYTSFIISSDHNSNLTGSSQALFGFKQIYANAFGGEIGYRNNRIGFRTIESSVTGVWNELWHSGNFNPASYMQTLSNGTTSFGEIIISGGNSVAVKDLYSETRQDANVRFLNNGFKPYKTLAGNNNYPSTVLGTGIRQERFSSATSQMGFDIYAVDGQDYLWFKTFGATNTERAWKILADRDWSNSITGLLPNLNTTDKTSLVNAINEVNSNSSSSNPKYRRVILDAGSYTTTGTLRIDLGNDINGWLRIRLTGIYHTYNMSGYIEVVGGVVSSTGALYEQSLRCIVSNGLVRNRFAIDTTIKRDANTGQIYIELFKKQASSDRFYVDLEYRQANNNITSTSWNPVIHSFTEMKPPALINEVTLFGNLDLEGGSLMYNTVNRLRFTSNATILSASNNGGIYLRPNGDNSEVGAVSISTLGRINTSSNGNSSQWKQAYDWGNHASAGYLTTFTETDPIYTASVPSQMMIKGAIPADADLNSYTDTGLYVQGANATVATFLNCPTDRAMTLEVIRSSGAMVWQRITDHQYNRIYVRNLTSGSWTSWKTLALSTDIVNTTYSAGNGITLNGTVFSLPITNSGSGNYVSGVTQTTNGLTVTYGTLPTNTDTVTRLRGTATGTLVSGDITLLAGANTSITQSGANITIASTNTTYTAGDGLTLSGTAFSLPVTDSGSGNYVTNVVASANGLTVSKATLPVPSLVTATTSTGTSNVVTTNTNTFLNIVYNGGSIGSSSQITGAGSVTVGSDASGKITITGTNTTYTAGTGLVLSGTSFGQTITTSGTGTFVTGITQTANGFQVNLGTPPNTTYSNMSLTEMNAGTVSTARLVSAVNLNSWFDTKSIFTQTSQNGIKTSIWTSNALSPYSIALGHLTNVSGTGSIGIGFSVGVTGVGSINQGFVSNLTGNFSSSLGAYNVNTADNATTVGVGLLNNQDGLTIIGRYNEGTTDMLYDDYNASKQVLVLAAGLDDASRKNIFTVYENDRTKVRNAIYYEPSQRTSSTWTDTTLIDKKYYHDNLPSGGGGTAGIQDYSSDILVTSYTGEIMRGYTYMTGSTLQGTEFEFVTIKTESTDLVKLDQYDMFGAIGVTDQVLRDEGTLLVKGCLFLDKDTAVAYEYNTKNYIMAIRNGTNVIITPMTGTEVAMMVNTARNMNSTTVMYMKLGVFNIDPFTGGYQFFFNPQII